MKVELVICLLLAAWAAGVLAQENAPAPPAPPAPAPAESPPGRPRPAPNEDVFIPTEELSAEDQVTFPVDI